MHLFKDAVRVMFDYHISKADFMVQPIAAVIAFANHLLILIGHNL